jgi:endonuclease G
MAKNKKKKESGMNRYKLLVYSILALFAFVLYHCGGTKVLTAESIDRLEVPVMSSGRSGLLIAREGYTLSYNRERLLPDWVAYELTVLETEGDEPRAKHFKKDPDISGLQADVDDYRNSGWDKGHMAPAADMKWSESAMAECFYLSNICPQDHKLNTGTWKRLEEKCREYARYFGNLYIVCGPVVKNNKHGSIGDNGVLVPDGFYKVLLTRYYDEYKGIGFLFENSKGGRNLLEHAVTIDEVERVTGIDFFHLLPDNVEKKVESEVDKAVWKL